MVGKNKTALLGWHPQSAEDAKWLRAEVERTGMKLSHLLNEALTVYRAFGEESKGGPGWGERLEARLCGQDRTEDSKNTKAAREGRDAHA